MNNRRDEIYDSITKKQIGILLAAGGLIGAVIFIICYGFAVLDVTNDRWLLKGGDLMQHYVGWKAYRQSPWQFPIGMTEGLIYPDETCVIYTDSIPLFAIFFKLLSPLLPGTFQYFGLWGIMSFILMGGISAVILRKGTDKLYLCVAGSVFFSFSPYVFQRMYQHTALAGQWVILFAIMIWLYKPYFNDFKKKTIVWSTLLAVASLIHIYYIPMVMLFMIFSCIQDVLENNGWKQDILMGIIAVAADLLLLYCVGAFSVSSTMQDVGLGVYSANLNVFWNPLGKGQILHTRPFREGQDEGFGYLGFGILLLLLWAVVLAAVYQFFKYRNRKQKEVTLKFGDRVRRFVNDNSFIISMTAAFLTSLILALSPVLTYNDKIIGTIPYPGIIVKLLSVFRASGRFIWCACYVIMIFAIMSVIKLIRDKRAAAIVVAVGLLIQIYDFFPFAVSRNVFTDDKNQMNIFTSERWEEITDGKTHLQAMPFNIMLSSFDSDYVYAAADFALNHGMTTNFYIAARVDYNKVAANEGKIREKLNKGVQETDTLYILDSEETGKAYKMTVEKIDGMIVGYFGE